jgi:hypothetical protein
MGEGTLPDLTGTLLAAVSADTVQASVGRILPDAPRVPVASFGSAI